MRGLVVRNTGSWYVVQADGGQLFRCKVKGSFRLRGIRSTSPVAVGDRVGLTPGADGETALIDSVLDRRNCIARRASNLSKQSHVIAANVDQAALVVTVAHPETSTTFVDRFLAVAEAYRVPVVLVINKTDLYAPPETALMERWAALYGGLGYEVARVSAAGGDLSALRPLLEGRVTLLGGNSGVGKSTLLNALLPGAEARVADLSRAYDMGTHTTTFSQMYFLPGGGALIDTPGVKGFGTYDMARGEVAHYFRELFRLGHGCRFADCTHTREPGCAVLAALARGEVAASRYASYLSMLGDEGEDRYRKPF